MAVLIIVIAALISFIIAVFMAFFADAPDVLDILGFIALGLALNTLAALLGHLPAARPVTT